MSLLDLKDKFKKYFASASNNLESWKTVATDKNLRRELPSAVAKNTANKIKVANQKTTNYFTPTSNKGQNFWSTPTAQKLANIQQRHEAKGGVKQYFFPTASGAAPEIARKYVADTAKLVPEIVTSLPKAASGLVKLNPVTSLINQVTGNNEKNIQNLSDVATPVLKGAQLSYRASPYGPVMGTVFGAIKGARNNRTFGEAMKEDFGTLNSKEDWNNIITEAMKGITEQPGAGEALSDNPKTQTIINTAYMVAWIFGNVYKKYSQTKAQQQLIDTEKEKLAKVLGIDKNASEAEAKEAYKNLVRQWHPDKPGGSEDKMAQINTAYQELEKLGFGGGGGTASSNIKVADKPTTTVASDKQLSTVLLSKGGDKGATTSLAPITVKTPTTKGNIKVGGETSIIPSSSRVNQAITDQTSNIKIASPQEEPVKLQTESQASVLPETKIKITDKTTLSSPSTATKTTYDPIIAEKIYKEAFSQYIAARDVAKTKATQEAKEIVDIPKNISQDVINYREGVTSSATPEVKYWSSKINKITDKLYNKLSTKAKEIDLGVGYLENYVPHYWQESEEEVISVFLSAKKKPSSTKQRVLPTYKEGIELGLTPRFNHPAQMIEQYIIDMGNFEAGIDLTKTLKNKGVVVSSQQARVNPGLSPIYAPGFTSGLSNLYAPTKVANQINQLFSPATENTLNKTINKMANFSSKFQDISLSGGAPGTPLNAFVLAQVQKEVLSGNIASPLTAIWKSMSNNKTQAFFDANANQIIKLQERNVPVRSDYSINNLIDEKTATRIFGHGVGNAWTKLVNEPTFGRFMPMLEINLFNKIEASAIKSGMSEKEAADLGAEVVSKFYGLTSTDVTASRSQIGQDLATTFLFAPQYRESMINVWLNTVKAVKNPFAKENQMNVRFAIGAVLAYLVMNAINKSINGHGMNENPENKKDKLLIPVGEYTIGIPYLSSIATIPRMLANMGGRLAEADVQGATLEGRKALSMLTKPLVDLMANEDYYGREIVDDFDSSEEKLKKQGEYLLTAYVAHPYLKELIELYTKPEKPVYQRLSMALELPLRFYKTESIELAPFWEKYYDLKEVKDKYDSIKYEDESKATDYLNEHEDDINEFNLMKAYLKFNYDQEEAGEEPTGIKDYLSLAKEEPQYEISEDAPKTALEKVSLYTKSAVINPIDTYKAVTTDQPIRKMRGDATVLERQIEGETDTDINTQKDHRIPLWAGGTNDDSNTYYISTQDHKAKTAFEAGLRVKLENGEMNKKQVQKAIKQWHEDNNIQSLEPPIKEPVISTDLTETAIDTYRSGNGQSVKARATWVIEQLEQITDEDEKQKLVDKLWEEKVITGGSKGVAQYLSDNFDLNVWQSESASGSGSSSSGSSSKAKSISIKKLTTPKISLTANRPSATIPNIKIGSAPNLKMSDYQVPKLTMPNQTALPKIRISADTPKLTVGQYR